MTVQQRVKFVLTIIFVLINLQIDCIFLCIVPDPIQRVEFSMKESQTCQNFIFFNLTNSPLNYKLTT